MQLHHRFCPVHFLRFFFLPLFLPVAFHTDGEGVISIFWASCCCCCLLLLLLQFFPASRRALRAPKTLDALRRAGQRYSYMEVVGCKTEAGSCSLRPGPGAMLFHGISGDHIQGIMEEMERRSKSESRLAKGMQLNGRDSVSRPVDDPWSKKKITIQIKLRERQLLLVWGKVGKN